jgi:hypothetical protein
MADTGTQETLRDERQDAARDKSIDKRLQRDPSDPDAGSDESMDASDPPAAAAPGSQEPAPSSGYDEAAERANMQQ